MKYVKIHVHGGSNYIQPAHEVPNAIDGELDGLEFEERVTITFEHIEMTEEEYNSLPEFTGH